MVIDSALMVKDRLDLLLEELLATYPNAKGVSFHSMESPIYRSKGGFTEVLDLYKDIPMLSVDEEFQTTFSFIITEMGSIIIFFINSVHFVSVYTENQDPNKQLATRMYESFHLKFEQVINELNESN